MRINVKALEKIGITVRVYQRNGKSREEFPIDLPKDVVIELFVDGGAPLPDEVVEAIKELVPADYAQGVVDGLYSRIHTLQLVDAINKTDK